MSATTFIYALCEPGTRAVRYIGKSDNLKKRFREHLNASSKKDNHLGRWLRSLKGMKPVLEVLHEVAENECWTEEERRYISCARAIGIDLVNGTDGGEGCSNPTPETRAAISAALKGVPKSPEARAAMSDAKKGAKASPETRAAMSAAMRGVPKGPMPPETRAAMSAARKGVPKGPMPPETRAAISAAKSGVSLSPEHCAAMSAARTGVPWSPACRAAYEARKLKQIS